MFRANGGFLVHGIGFQGQGLCNEGLPGQEKREGAAFVVISPTLRVLSSSFLQSGHL